MARDIISAIITVHMQRESRVFLQALFRGILIDSILGFLCTRQLSMSALFLASIIGCKLQKLC